MQLFEYQPVCLLNFCLNSVLTGTHVGNFQEMSIKVIHVDQASNRNCVRYDLPYIECSEKDKK